MLIASLKPGLLCSVSYTVLDVGFETAVGGVADAPLSLLARIGLWLRLLWRGGDADVSVVTYGPRRAPNRTEARRSTRRMPLSRRGCALAPILYRSFGRARYLRFLYDDSLIGRVRWCFTAWNWKWVKRVFLKENPRKRAAKHAKPYRVFCATPLILDPD